MGVSIPTTKNLWVHYQCGPDLAHSQGELWTAQYDALPMLMIIPNIFPLHIYIRSKSDSWSILNLNSL